MKKVFFVGPGARKQFDGRDWLVNEVHEVEDEYADKLLRRRFFKEVKKKPGRPKKSA